MPIVRWWWQRVPTQRTRRRRDRASLRGQSRRGEACSCRARAVGAVGLSLRSPPPPHVYQPSRRSKCSRRSDAYRENAPALSRKKADEDFTALWPRKRPPVQRHFASRDGGEPLAVTRFFASGDARVGGLEADGHGPWFADRDAAVVELPDGRDLGRRTGQEHLVGDV